jgi:ParB-like chromosome segregation protein Spo0J
MSQDRPFQVTPPLSEDELAALRASIESRGVVVPVVVDQHGRVLEGHHRKDIADDLEIDYPTVVRHVDNNEEAMDIAIELNAARRHLTQSQMRGLIYDEIERKQRQESNRALGERLGVSHPTVGLVRRAMENGVPRQNIVDGYAKPAPRPYPEVVNLSSDEEEVAPPGAVRVIDPATGLPRLIDDRTMWKPEFRRAFRQEVAERPVDEVADHPQVPNADLDAARRMNLGTARDYAHGLRMMIDDGWLDKDTPDALRRLLWDLHAAIEDGVPRPDDDVTD